MFGLLSSLSSVATPPLMGQRPNPDGSDRHPSDLRYPLNTWIRQEPLGWDLPNKQRRVTAAATGIMNKLQSIVIPRIEFRQTTLSDAVEYLRQESRRLDPDPDPNHRGVNIFLRLTQPLPVVDTFVESVPGLPLSQSAPVDPNTRISLTMERLPLLEALRYVASQGGLKVDIKQYGVSIVPVSYAIQALVTADYLVPPELLGLPSDVRTHYPKDITSQGGEVTIPRLELTSWFVSKGISFPTGAMATYLPATGKLVIRNTQENLDKMVSVISSALKPPVPQNP